MYILRNTSQSLGLCVSLWPDVIYWKWPSYRGGNTIKRYGGMEWTDLAEDRDKQQAVLNMIMNLRNFLF